MKIFIHFHQSRPGPEVAQKSLGFGRKKTQLLGIRSFVETNIWASDNHLRFVSISYKHPLKPTWEP